MAASAESQCVDVYISDSSQTQHLSAIIAAAGARKVNIYFTSSSIIAAGAAGDLQDSDSKLSNVDDSEPDPAAPTRIGFGDLPLELQINIFKLVFIRDTPREFHVSRICKKEGEGKETRIYDFGRAQMSGQLLRVSQLWNQYGSAMILENVIYPTSGGTLANATSHSKKHDIPGLRLLKHLQLHAWDLNKTTLQRLCQYKHLQSVVLVDGYRFWAFDNGFEPGGQDPILECRSTLVDFMDTRRDFAFRTRFKTSLNSVKYTFETHYWRTRLTVTGETEVRTVIRTRLLHH
jgi:hypothetical protein